MPYIFAFLFLISLTELRVGTNNCSIEQLQKCNNTQVVELFQNSLEPYDYDVAIILERELVQRKAVEETFLLFAAAIGLIETSWTFDVLHQLKGPEATRLLRPLATKSLSLQAYFANYYFAEDGHEFALENFNSNYFQYSMASRVWAIIVRFFGEHKYYPAQCNIVGTIRAADVSLGAASINALEQLYPEVDILNPNGLVEIPETDDYSLWMLYEWFKFMADKCPEFAQYIKE